MEKPELIVKQLDDRYWHIEESSGGGGGVNCFLVLGEKKAMLVDSGFGHEDLMTVVTGLTTLPIMLVNTHADRDHVMGNQYFDTAYMHPAEYDRYHSAVGKDAPVEALWEGDVVDLGGVQLEVILIPGHTPGSIVLLDRENRILIGGDSVQGGMVFMVGAGRNLSGYIGSMQKLKKIQGLFDRVYTGHGAMLEGSDMLDALIAGALQLKNGEAEGEEAPGPFGDSGAKVYKIGRATFLYG